MASATSVQLETWFVLWECRWLATPPATPVGSVAGRGRCCHINSLLRQPKRCLPPRKSGCSATAAAAASASLFGSAAIHA